MQDETKTGGTSLSSEISLLLSNIVKDLARRRKGWTVRWNDCSSVESRS